jgi:hypothetical protein
VDWKEGMSRLSSAIDLVRTQAFNNESKLVASLLTNETKDSKTAMVDKVANDERHIATETRAALDAIVCAVEVRDAEVRLATRFTDTTEAATQARTAATEATNAAHEAMVAIQAAASAPAPTPPPFVEPESTRVRYEGLVSQVRNTLLHLFHPSFLTVYV